MIGGVFLYFIEMAEKNDIKGTWDDIIGYTITILQNLFTKQEIYEMIDDFEKIKEVNNERE